MIGIGQHGPLPWRGAAANMEAEVYNTSSDDPERSGQIFAWDLGNNKFENISNNLFTKPPWMCRNQTLLKAIEDLANNITISMLSSPNLV